MKGRKKMISNCFSKYLKKKKPIVKKLVETLGQDFEYVSCLGTDVKGFSVRSDRAVTNVGTSRLTESGFVVKVKGADVAVAGLTCLSKERPGAHGCLGEVRWRAP